MGAEEANRRQFYRYNVSQLKEMKCELQTAEENLVLVSFSQGGCGFYATRIDQRLQLPENPELERKRRVVIQLSFSNELDLELQANLLYCQEIQIRNTPVYYYGFEFIESDRDKLDPVIERLEKLRDEGKISEV